MSQRRPAASSYEFALFAGANGELLGSRRHRVAELSPEWLDFWRNALAEFGPAFKGPLPIAPLSHIELHFAAADEGAALVTFLVAGRMVTSGILLSGQNPAAEGELLKVFVDSLRQIEWVRARPGDTPPFEAMYDLVERPLDILVLWGNPAVDDEDFELVKELEFHLAAVFLCD